MFGVAVWCSTIIGPYFGVLLMLCCRTLAKSWQAFADRCFPDSYFENFRKFPRKQPRWKSLLNRFAVQRLTTWRKVNSIRVFFRRVFQNFRTTIFVSIIEQMLLKVDVIIMWYGASKEQASRYLLKVNNRNIRTRCEIYSNLTIKTP